LLTDLSAELAQLIEDVVVVGNDDALVNTLNAGIDRGIASVQAKLPLTFDPGIMVTGVRPEDRTIIYTMDFQLPPVAGGQPKWSTICVGR
jgi:hypothetical protein